MDQPKTVAQVSCVAPGGMRRALACVLAAGGLVALGGCEIDNYIDPSVVGRWEVTPTVVPILERLSAIEGPEEVYVEYSEVQPEDLVPELAEYKVGPGDVVQVSVFNLRVMGQAELFERRIDSRGYLEVPEAGAVFVDGMTLEAVRRAVHEAVRPITGDTQVDVVVAQEQQRTFNVIGAAVGGAGPYFVPYADYRLIDALAAAGGFLESIEYIYVIRQVPLSDEATGRSRVTPSGAQGTPPEGGEPGDGENLLNVIDDLLAPSTPGAPTGGSPGAFSASSDRGTRGALPIELIEAVPGMVASQPTGEQPVQPPPSSTGQWLYLNGEWVLVSREASTPGAPGVSQLFTQRVIRIPVKPLVAGDARYNIVIRPNDIVRVPAPLTGTVFLAGQVARPGSFGLAPKLTLTRAIYAGGGLGPTAVPERTDLIRMVGPSQQAMVRLNLRAITEGSQPDVFLRDNDVINVGTNFWAYPLAVLRGGLRGSYGYGFLLDRNFGNDVFGVPPGSVNGN